MKTVLFGSDKDGLRNLLEGNQVHIYRESLVTQKEFFNELEMLQKNEVDKVVITETIPGPHNKYELVEKLASKCEELELDVIFVLGEKDDEFILHLREKRIYKVFDTDSNPDDLIAAIFFDPETELQESKSSEVVEGPIVKEVEKHYVDKTILTIASPGGGGTGKSTMVINMASILAKKHKDAKIAIIELNEEKTDLFDFTESGTKMTGMDLISKKMDELTEQQILDAMNVSSIEKNMYVLSGLRATEHWTRFNRTIYKYIIKTIQKHHDFVLIDTGSFNSEATIQSILHSDRVLFICSNTKRHLRTLNEKFDLYNKVISKNIKKHSDILINFDKAYGVESLQEVEDVMEIKPIGRVKYCEKLASAFAKNKPISKVNGSKARALIKVLSKYVDQHFIYLKR